MKNLYYGGQVFQIPLRTAEKLGQVVHALLYDNASTLLPIAVWHDDREITIEILVGPGVSFMVTDRLGYNARDPENTDECIDLLEDIRAEHEDSSD